MSEFGRIDGVAAAENLGRRVRRLELAHVEADHALLRAEQELGERLGELGLAGAGRAGEQEHADRLAGIVEARLQHGDAVDDGADRLVLADDARGKIAAHGGEIDALAVVEDAGRQPRELCQGLDDVARRDGRAGALRGAIDAELQQIERGTGQAGGGQVLACRGDGGVDGGGLDLDAIGRRDGARDIAGQLFGLVRLHRLEAGDLEGAAERGAQAHDARGSGGRGFRPYDQAAGGDGREDLIEDAGCLPLVGAAEGDLQDVGDVPDDFLGGGELLDGALDAPLELAEPFLSGHQVGTAGFEDAPAKPFEPAAEQLEERGLADAHFAAHQQRARMRAEHVRSGFCERIGPVRRLDEDVVGGGLPEAAERGEERAINV